MRAVEFRDVVHARRSVRDFRPEPVSPEGLRRVIEAARLAPSSSNEQPWRFYVASGEKRRELGRIIAQATIHLSEYMDVLGPRGYEAAARWYSSLGSAPTLVAVTAQTSDDSLVARNRHISVGAAIENLLLAVVNEGWAACNITYSHWVEDELATALGLPDGWEILTVVAIGKPGEDEPKAQERRADDTVWFE
jgi:nitroreductase